MDNVQTTSNNLVNTNSSMFSKNNIIIILVVILSFSFLGINILTIFGNLVRSLINIFGPLITQILSIFGYTAGTVINKSVDIVGDTAKTGIDITGGAVQSIGNILKGVSAPAVDINAKNQLDQTLNLSSLQVKNAQPDSTVSPIQNPIPSGKNGWCLVGEYLGRRGCISVTEQDKCLSGQVYPNQALCLNPNLSQNPEVKK